MSIPYIKEESKSRFFVPKTLERDFDKFLDNDIPGSVETMKLYHNWYDQENYEDVRIEIYPDSTKSRYEDTDNNLNIRASRSSSIQKGDYLKSEDGTIYLLDWDIAPESNNRASRAVRCNLMLKVKRFRNNPITQYGEELVDEFGFVIDQPSQVEQYDDYTVVCEDIPCNAYHYDGRPEYSVISSNPGVTPNNLVILNVQKNDLTYEINIDDYFVWGKNEYVVMDINYVGVNLLNGNGVLKIQAKKKAGTTNE